jgi:hypothetical protein
VDHIESHLDLLVEHMIKVKRHASSRVYLRNRGNISIQNSKGKRNISMRFTPKYNISQ